MRFAALAILCWTMTAAPASALTRATGLSADAGSVSVRLDGPATAKQLVLDAPRRLVVDLAGVDAGRQQATGSGGIAARIGPFDTGTARIVIDIPRPMRIGGASLKDGTLVIRLAPTAAADFSAAAKRGREPLVIAAAAEPPKPTPPRSAIARPVPDSAAPSANDFDLPSDIFGTKAPPVVPEPALRNSVEAAPPPPASLPPPRSGGRKPLVVVDAGHGGKDVGAIAFNGRYEKDVTLAIARMVAKTLAASGRVRVKLTREDDRFIPLGGRVAIARAARADLFVSIHADSAANTQARGASVYTLSDTASDAVAARLAARENKADIIGGVNLGIEAPEVGDVMIALMRRSTLNTAVAFAETLQAELDDRIPFRARFHHFAGFLVLKAADVPSVLLETGYVSNSEDAEFLFSRKGQKIVGEGVARAIERHLTAR